MKMTKKKVFIAALAICVVAILSLGSLAWFTDTDTVVNNFYVADSDDDNKVFTVDVWEHVDADDDDTVDDGEQDQDGITYNNIRPGQEIEKIPYVENTCDYDQWVRVKVTVSNHDMWVTATNNNMPLLSMINVDTTNTWSFDGTTDFAWNDTEGKSATYTFYLNAALLKDSNPVKLFDTVSIPEGLTNEMIDAVLAAGTDSNVLQMDILAQAVQHAELNATDVRDAFVKIPMA